MIPDLATVDTSMQLIDQYSDYQRARGFSGHTIARRRTSVEGFRKFILPAELDTVGAEAVEEWLLTKPSMKTRHAYRSDLKVFYDWAIRRAGFTGHRHRPDQDAEGVTPPDRPRSPRRVDGRPETDPPDGGSRPVRRTTRG
jgi:site-specific recombinase XerD